MESSDELTSYMNAHPGGWNRAMGLRFERATADEVVAELEIGDAHRQVYGIVHGGVYCGVVETVCSVGAAVNAMTDGRYAVGMENHTSFLRAVREGTLRARATPVSRGRRTQVWKAEIHDGDQRLVATGQVRLMCLEPDAKVAGEQVTQEGDRQGG